MDDTISRQALPSAEPEITNEEIRFALKQLRAYLAIKIRDGKDGSVPVELSQLVKEIQKYFENMPSAHPTHTNTPNALESLDCISRQAAIDVLAKLIPYAIDDDVSRAYTDGLTDAYDLICQLPSAQPEHRWVQVEDTLPEDGHEVWVTIKGHDVIYCRAGETIEEAVERISKERWVTRAYWSKEENGWNDPAFGCPLIVRPIAWMDIDVPEPFREELHE